MKLGAGCVGKSTFNTPSESVAPKISCRDRDNDRHVHDSTRSTEMSAASSGRFGAQGPGAAVAGHVHRTPRVHRNDHNQSLSGCLRFVYMASMPTTPISRARTVHAHSLFEVRTSLRAARRGLFCDPISNHCCRPSINECTRRLRARFHLAHAISTL